MPRQANFPRHANYGFPGAHAGCQGDVLGLRISAEWRGDCYERCHRGSRQACRSGHLKIVQLWNTRRELPRMNVLDENLPEGRRNFFVSGAASRCRQIGREIGSALNERRSGQSLSCARLNLTEHHFPRSAPDFYDPADSVTRVHCLVHLDVDVNDLAARLRALTRSASAGYEHKKQANGLCSTSVANRHHRLAGAARERHSLSVVEIAHACST